MELLPRELWLPIWRQCRDADSVLASARTCRALWCKVMLTYRFQPWRLWCCLSKKSLHFIFEAEGKRQRAGCRTLYPIKQLLRWAFGVDTGARHVHLAAILLQHLTFEPTLIHTLALCCVSMGPGSDALFTLLWPYLCKVFKYRTDWFLLLEVMSVPSGQSPAMLKCCLKHMATLNIHLDVNRLFNLFHNAQYPNPYVAHVAHGRAFLATLLAMPHMCNSLGAHQFYRYAVLNNALPILKTLPTCAHFDISDIFLHDLLRLALRFRYADAQATQYIVNHPRWDPSIHNWGLLQRLYHYAQKLRLHRPHRPEKIKVVWAALDERVRKGQISLPSLRTRLHYKLEMYKDRIARWYTRLSERKKMATNVVVSLSTGLFGYTLCLALQNVCGIKWDGLFAYLWRYYDAANALLTSANACFV